MYKQKPSGYRPRDKASGGNDLSETDEAVPKRRLKLSERQSKFVREVGSVVLGVLIALGIGEIAEAVRWQWRVSTVERMVGLELSVNAGVFDERLLAQPCIERRLAALGAVLAEARRTGRLPLITEIHRVPGRPLNSEAWETALGAGSTLHMSTESAARLSLFYTMIARYGRANEAEREGWSQLRALEGAAGPVSDDLLASLTLILAETRDRGRQAGNLADQLVRSLGASGYVPNYAMVADRETMPRADLAREVTARPICKPLVVDGKPYQPVVGK